MTLADSQVSELPERTLQYLLPHANAFWRWSADGKSVEWLDGRTIAFRPEILFVLTRSAGRGLPSFESIVLLFAATRENWAGGDAAVKDILTGYREVLADAHINPEKSGQWTISFVLPARIRQELRSLVEDLSAVAELPADLRSTLAGRSALIELLLTDQPAAIQSAEAAAVLELLDGGVEATALQQPFGRDSNFQRLADVITDLQTAFACRGAAPLADRLALWMRAGIDQLINPAEIDPPLPDRIGTLIRSLRGDSELGNVAALAQQVLAALHVPRSLAQPDEIPVGGVSDISNRGTPDRLLVSELANDDFTLLTRLAMNEALYLRRESPANHPPTTRAILLDSGIRLWGTPRLIATAVGMALASSADRRGGLAVARACGASSLAIDFATRTGVAAHMAALEVHTHPGVALMQWMQSLSEAATEIFVVTHRAVLDDPEFLATLRAANSERALYFATVTADGAFELWHLSSAGRRKVSQAKLSLSEMMPRPSAVTNTQPDSANQFPTILSMRPFPLLLPALLAPPQAVVSERYGLIGYSPLRRILRWKSGSRGAEQLLDRIPAGQVHSLLFSERSGTLHLIVSESRLPQVSVVTLKLESGEESVITLPLDRPVHTFLNDETVHLVYGGSVVLAKPGGGVEQTIATDPNLKWIHGRFVRHNQKIFAWSADGLIEVDNRAACIAAFDREGGPWVLYGNGDVGPAGEHPISPLRPWSQVERIGSFRISADGNRVVAQFLDGSRPTQAPLAVLDLTSKPRWRWELSEDKKRFQQMFDELVGPKANWASGHAIQLRSHLEQIGFDHNGLPVLIPPGDRPAVEVVEDAQKGLMLRSLDRDMQLGADAELNLKRFLQIPSPQGVRYTLREARWRDGSRTLLDSRGLLHLVSSDPTLPQICLALADVLSGWTSHGQTFGWQYFFKESPTFSSAEGANLVREFARRLDD